MALKLMYITNDSQIAKIAEDSGVDWIFIDLEINGKDKRQGHLDTVISRHSIGDIKKIKATLRMAKLLVRVNPIYEGSKVEVEKVVNDGADIIMLPFFKTKEEVQAFIGHVGGRAKTCLLIETPEAVEKVDSIFEVEGIDYVHIGLNDLHLGYGMKFMFELLADGTVDELCNKAKEQNIQYGFGGIAQLSHGMLPAENIITEHYRLGSNMTILSRSFCNPDKIQDLDNIERTFKAGVSAIRNYEMGLLNENESYYLENKIIVRQKVSQIVNAD